MDSNRSEPAGARVCTRTARVAVAVLLVVAGLIPPRSAAGEGDDLVAGLRKLDTRAIVLGTVRREPLAGMTGSDVAARLRAANRAEREAWEKVKTRADWERFRDARIDALRKSLGEFPPPPKDLKIRVTRTAEGDGYRVDNLVFESRPGLTVTANLYRPARPPKSMPGIVLSLSHHQPKHVGARQDMGMTWARAGCLVLVPDHLGHGERRQHPFAEGVPHDYHFRYDLGIRLHLAGESLTGWLAWDLMRGVDVLLKQPGIDSQRILLISEPAGGGDIAAVAAALDPRISGVMVNNFGGPEPETPYPLAADAEESFDYSGSGSWESTRNLRLSARDGFLPWVIVASVAPRKLIYYHEFYWDREQDPVWKRLRRVYELYDAGESLVGLAGRGFVVGSEPENTHWIPASRELLYPILERWFAVPDPKTEYSRRIPAEDLLCLKPEGKAAPIDDQLARLGRERAESARQELARLRPEERRESLRSRWSRLLGDVSPRGDPVLKEVPPKPEQLGTVSVERMQLGTEPGIVVPVVLLLPAKAREGRVPVVVGFAQEGKQALLKHRAESVAELLRAGIAVCLADLRGTGETAPGPERDRRSAATAISSSELILGQSLLGGRLRDLRAVLRLLRSRSDLDPRRVGLWGDSFAEPNPAGRELKVPHNAATRPAQSEPLGGLLALLGALFEEDIAVVYAHGGLSDYQSVLRHPFCYLPHDVVVPGVLPAGDLPDLAAALAPRPLRLSGLIDGLNRDLSPAEPARTYEPTRSAYASDRFRIEPNPPRPADFARWFVASLGSR